MMACKHNCTRAACVLVNSRADVNVCENGLCFPPLFLLNMSVLPRQARDKHSRESTQKRDRFFSGEGPRRQRWGRPDAIAHQHPADAHRPRGVSLLEGRPQHLHVRLHQVPDARHLDEAPVRRRHFLSTLCIKCIILPRQARDEQRENSNKCRLLAGSRPCGRTSRRGWRWRSVRRRRRGRGSGSAQSSWRCEHITFFY